MGPSSRRRSAPRRPHCVRSPTSATGAVRRPGSTPPSSSPTARSTSTSISPHAGGARSRAWSRSSESSVHGRAGPSFLEHPHGLGAIAVARRPNRQPLQILVDLEELLDLGAEGLGNVVEIADSSPQRVPQRDAHELVVGALLVDHVEDAYRPDTDPATGKGGVTDQDEGVERVAVLTERPLDEAVVGGVDRRGEEAPIEDDLAELGVVLVLVTRPARNLDRDDDLSVWFRNIGHAR